MTAERPLLVEGQTVLLTSGYNDDYGHEGLFVAMTNITASMLNTVRADIREEDAHEFCAYPRGEFVDQLVRRGWLVSMDFTKLHIGGYFAEVEEFFEPPQPAGED